MIEKIAKSIFLADFPNDNWERFKTGDVVNVRYIKLARAAIKAMRDLYKCVPGPLGNSSNDVILNGTIDIILKE